MGITSSQIKAIRTMQRKRVTKRFNRAGRRTQNGPYASAPDSRPIPLHAASPELRRGMAFSEWEAVEGIRRDFGITQVEAQLAYLSMKSGRPVKGWGVEAVRIVTTALGCPISSREPQDGGFPCPTPKNAMAVSAKCGGRHRA